MENTEIIGSSKTCSFQIKIRYLLIFISIISSLFFCEASEEIDIVSRWEVGVRSGYAFTSNPVLLDRMIPEGEITHSAMSWHLRYSFQRPNKGRNASVYQGIGVSVNSFFQSHEIGVPIGLYVFQGAPIFSISNKLSFYYEWNFGASFGWEKTTNGSDIRSNLVVGSPTNAYLNLGFKLDYAVSDNFKISGGLDLTHYSNGNTSWPNPGVNTAGISMSVIYIPGNRILKPISPFTDENDFSKGISYDVMVYGAWRKAYFPAEDGAFTEFGEKALLPGHFGVAGFTFAPMWDLHPVFRTGLSTDIQWSENTALTKYLVPGTSGEDSKFYRPPFFRQVSLEISARAELVMPIFSLNAGIGYCFIGPPETRKLYQTINLKTYIAGPLFLNIGYRMIEFHSPSNLMLGFGFTLGR